MTLLDESVLQTACRGCHHVGRTVRVVRETASTNDLCHDASNDWANAGLVIFTEHQTAGRGQHGRQWSVPRGSSLLFSMLIYPPAHLDQPHVLVAWSAAAIAEQLQLSFGLPARIKWPNDILVRGRKIAGILVERAKGTVVGVGINGNLLERDFPAELRMPATSIAIETGRTDWNATQFAADLILRLDHQFGDALKLGPDPLWIRWQRMVLHQEGDSVVAIARQTQVIGRLLDLRPQHGARIARADGTIARIPAEELLRLEYASDPHGV